MPCCYHNSSISKDTEHLADRWFSVLSSTLLPRKLSMLSLQLSRALVTLAWLLGKAGDGMGWDGMGHAEGSSWL